MDRRLQQKGLIVKLTNSPTSAHTLSVIISPKGTETLAEFCPRVRRRGDIPSPSDQVISQKRRQGDKQQPGVTVGQGPRRAGTKQPPETRRRVRMQGQGE